MDLVGKVAGFVWGVLLPVIGALSVAAMAAMFLYAWKHHRANKREARARRVERARACTPDAVEGRAGLPVWLDFVRDQDLHQVPTPKEQT